VNSWSQGPALSVIVLPQVKVAIIVAIVVVSLALLAMAACLVMCLCRRPRRVAPVPAGKQFIDA
jgi:hypothetical protein